MEGDSADHASDGSGGEKAVLYFGPPLVRPSIIRNLPWAVFVMMVLFFAVRGVGGGGPIACTLAVVVSIAGLLAIEKGAATATVIVDADSVQLPRFLWLTRDVPFDDIGRFKLARRSEWFGARVTLELKGAERKKFFTFSTKEYEFPLPGDVRFQAKVVNAVLSRRPGIPIDEKAGKLLVGELGVSLKHRLPVIFAASGAVVVLICCLVASVRALSPPTLLAFVMLLFGAVCKLAPCLVRESEGRANLASLGLGAAALIAPAFGIAMYYGGLEYMPMVYATGLALAAGAFAAALPMKIPAKKIAAAETALLAALVWGTWSLTLRDTIPVQEVLLAPAPMEVGFSPSGNVVVAGGDTVDKKACHFLDRRSLAARTVPVDESPLLPVPVGDDRLLWVKRFRKGKHILRMLGADGEKRKLYESGRIGLLLPTALSPDGKSFAFFAGEAEDPVARSLVVLDLDTLKVREHGIPSEPSVWEFSLTWRRDGRLVWPAKTTDTEPENSGRSAGRFSVSSWAPGEENPRLEFESREPWSYAVFSRGCEAAVATLHEGGREKQRLVRPSDGSGFDLPAIHDFAPIAYWQWSADGRVFAFVPESNPRAVAVARTDTGEVRTVHESSFGEIHGVTVSPDRKYVAFGVPGGFSRWVGAVYVTEVETGRTRRIRPLPPTIAVDWVLTGGVGAWSPSGDMLAIVTCIHPMVEYHARGAAAVWLVSADDM